MMARCDQQHQRVLCQNGQRPAWGRNWTTQKGISDGGCGSVMKKLGWKTSRAMGGRLGRDRPRQQDQNLKVVLTMPPKLLKESPSPFCS